MSPYILTLDPSLANTGYVVYKCENATTFTPVDCGLICTKKSDAKNHVLAGDDIMRRWKEITNGLVALHKKYNFSLVAAEVTNGGVQSNAAAQSLFGVKALVAAYTEILNIPALFVNPRQVKEALASDHSASKDEMMALADKLTGLGKYFPGKVKRGSTVQTAYNDKFEHVADAVGVFEAIRSSTMVKMMAKVVANEN